MKALRDGLVTALICTGFLTSCSGVRTGRPPEPPKPLPGPQLALDPAFGNGGEVTTDLGQSEDIAAVELQDDEKILAVGGSFREATQSSSLVLARYLSSGELDTSFGANGYVFTPTGSAEADPSWGGFEVVTLQDDGKILAAGYAALNVDEHYTPGTVLARYNSDGSLDTSFGIEGFVRAEPGTGSVTALELQPDGKLVVLRDTWSADEAVLSRFTAAGQEDTSFGAGGVFALPYRPTETGEEPHLLQTSDGGFVLSLDTRLVRLTAAGVKDASFGNDGEVDTGYEIVALAQQEDGAIVVGQYSKPNYGVAAQTSEPNPTDFRLMRYSLNGDIDSSFGEAGVVFTDINFYDSLAKLAVQSDGKITAAGQTQDVVAVVRYTASGEVDASFVGAFGGAYALAIGEQNRIVVGGARLEGDTYDFALARLLP